MAISNTSIQLGSLCDSEIESLTSLDASLIELDRRNAAQTPSDCGVGHEYT